jgi:hypothetical protein
LDNLESSLLQEPTQSFAATEQMREPVRSVGIDISASDQQFQREQLAPVDNSKFGRSMFGRHSGSCNFGFGKQ